MWSESFAIKIARILMLMAEKPNAQPHPVDQNITIFDGGELSAGTGLMKYRFSDGSEAFYGTGPDWSLSIRLGGGEQISIDAAPKYCSQCGQPIWLGESDCRICRSSG